MDAAITSGPVMTTIGVGAVFAALGLLIAVVAVTSRLINRRENGSGGRRDKDRTSRQETPAVQSGVAAGRVGREHAASDARDQHLRRLAIALAAYGLHLRRSIAVRKPGPISQWGAASRVAQRERSPGKTT